MRRLAVLVVVAVVGCGAVFASQARAQTFGIELHNSLMPASGGMAGVSISRPQDLQSALNANPATLTQFRGTQFGFGAGWAEPTYNINQLAPLPLVGVTPYRAKSGTPGSSTPNIGVTQDLSALGLPVTIGMGLLTNAGLGVDFRGVPQSNGTSAQYVALDITNGVGVDLTDRLSMGASVTIGNSYLDGPFTDTGGMVPDYALRSALGVNYFVFERTSLGFYWQTRKDFTFQDAAVFPGGVFLPGGAVDVKFDHPQNFGLGLADNSLLDGRLLLASDVVYKAYSDADFFRAVYVDQWVFQTGLQYALTPRMRLRLGYAYNTNPMRGPVTSSIGGVTLPDGVPGLRYVQGQFAAICQNRITAGVGMRDVLPGLDLDVFGGGMFQETDQFASTFATVESYWVGAGITWRFGRGACEYGPWR
ncbi:MAG: hypothetical protein RIC55_09755 [Pirellulaceae bacterium]